MTHWILGVDPGSVAGWGLVDPTGKPVIHGQTGRASSKGKPAQRTTGEDVRRVLVEVAQLTPIITTVLAIEGQFLKDEAARDGKNRHKAVATLKTARSAGIWIGACEAHGMKVYHHKGEPAIQSQVWRRGVWGFRPREDQVKAYAVKMAKDAWGIVIPKTRHHEAESLWIAKFVSDILRMESRQQGLGL